MTDGDVPELPDSEDIQVNEKQVGELLHKLQEQSPPSDTVLSSQGNHLK